MFYNSYCSHIAYIENNDKGNRMETIKKLLSDILNIEFVQAVLSNPRKKEGILKVKVRPIEKKGNLLFQLESFTKTQAFHENLDPISARDRLLEYMEELRQMQVSTVHMNYTVLVSKKGKVTIQKKASKGSVRPVELSHNRSKKYILEEGIPVPFLQDLGVMTKDGKLYIPDLISSVRSTGFWNLLRIFFRSLRRTERSRFWILDVENRI